MAGRGTSTLYVFAMLTLAGCSTASPPTTASPSHGPATSSTPSSGGATPRPGCPEFDGGTCLGPIQAGTYRTVEFHPQITFAVPAGWGNYEDLPGNFLLVPPGGSILGVNPGTSDYLGVYTGVAAETQECTGELPAAGVGKAPEQIAAYWARIPSITVTANRPATVGGLSGVVVDMVANLAHPGMCTDATSSWGYQPLLVGVGPGELEHGMIKALSLRVYLLSWPNSSSGQPGTSTIAIEIDDLHGGSHLDAYSQVASAFQFGS